jgi:regulator of nucleoside diphosphate kinase
MQTTISLSQADYTNLSALLYHKKPGLFPVPQSHTALGELLTGSSRHADESAASQNHVGLGDKIRLVSPSDEKDFYEPSIVMPEEANLEADRLSILTPIGFAVIGRRIGEVISWATPRGDREMKIAAIHKCECTPS